MKLLRQPVWPERHEEGRGTMAYWTTRGHMMLNLGMALLQGDTTQSSTHDTQQTKTDFETSHNQSETKSV
jgi:hypothetical protein